MAEKRKKIRGIRPGSGKPGPGRPKLTKGGKPKKKFPRWRREEVIEEIARTIGMKRFPQDLGKPFRPWELAEILEFVLLAKQTFQKSA